MQCPDCSDKVDVAQLCELEQMTRDELVAEVKYLRVRVDQLMSGEDYADNA